MCLAIPGKLIEVNDGSGVMDVDGVRREVSLLLLQDAKVGDYIIVHAGFGIQIVHEDAARQSLDILKQAVARYDKEAS